MYKAEMEIIIDEQIKLKLFNLNEVDQFFESIHQENPTNDSYRANLQRKYSTLQKLVNRIEDAVENKFKIDGTPDFFIYLNNQIAGMFEFHPLTKDNFIEVGFWLYPEFRRKGLLTKVFPAMIKYAKNNFSKDKILATTSIENVPSQKLLESNRFLKIGLTEEVLSDGTVEKQYIYELPL